MTQMTCDQCRQIIAVADLTDWGDMDAVAAHCHTCDACAAVVTDVRDSARRVAELLDSVPAGVSSALVARRAAAGAALERQQTRRRRAVLYPLGGGAAAVTLVALVVGLRATSRHEGRNIAFRCLTAEQAATLVAPIMGREGTAAFRMVGPRIMTLNGSPAALREAERVIAQYDNEGSLAPGESCLLPASPPNVAPDVVGAQIEAAHAADMAKAEAQRAVEEARLTVEEAQRTAQEARRSAEDAARRAADRKP
jgi:hypothetical protein